VSAGTDLAHTAQPDFLRVRPTFEGRVILSRCATCHGRIWRTAERFIWSHSVPSRTARIGVPA
jgi:hypothetical protein